MPAVTAALRLYDTVDQLEIVRSWVDEHAAEIIAAGGDIAALPELAALIDQAELQFTDKAERVALYIREMIVYSRAVKEEADRLLARAKHAEKAAESLKAYLRGQLERAGVPKIEGKLCGIRIQKNPPSVKCAVDETELAARFHGGAEYVVEVPASYRVDTAIVLTYHKSNRPLPIGITVEQGTHVRIS